MVSGECHGKDSHVASGIWRVPISVSGSEREAAGRLGVLEWKLEHGTWNLEHGCSRSSSSSIRVGERERGESKRSKESSSGLECSGKV